MCKWNNTTRIIGIKTPKGNNIFVDNCISRLIQVLNDNGFKTIASCCGHGKQIGSIILNINNEEKEMYIMTFDQARIVDKLFPPIN